MPGSEGSKRRGYDAPPWHFKGKALYQLSLVRVEEAKKYVPPELPLVNVFGWTLGGFYLARYTDSPVGAFDEMVALAGLAWNFPTSCAWAARVYVNNREARNHGIREVGLPSRIAGFRALPLPPLAYSSFSSSSSSTSSGRNTSSKGSVGSGGGSEPQQLRAPGGSVAAASVSGGAGRVVGGGTTGSTVKVWSSSCGSCPQGLESSGSRSSSGSGGGNGSGRAGGEAKSPVAPDGHGEAAGDTLLERAVNQLQSTGASWWDSHPLSGGGSRPQQHGGRGAAAAAGWGGGSGRGGLDGQAPGTWAVELSNEEPARRGILSFLSASARRGRGLASGPVCRIELPPQRQGAGPRITMCLPSFSGATPDYPGFLQYDLKLQANIRPVPAARLAFPPARPCEERENPEVLDCVLGGRPLICLEFANMEMEVQAPVPWRPRVL